MTDAVNCLEALGFSKPEARLITALGELGEADTTDLIAHGLAQPDISIAAKSLHGTGLIEVSNVEPKGKGRPRNHYKLRKTDTRRFIKKELARIREGVAIV